MPEESSSRFVAIIIIFGLLVICGLLFMKMNIIDDEKAFAEKELGQYRSSCDKQLTTLNSEVNQLNTEIVQLKTKNTQLSQDISSLATQKENITGQFIRLKMDIASTINDLEDYKKDVSESMSWFNANSILDESRDMQWTKKNIGNQCYRIIDRTCMIKTACFYLVNENMLNIFYQRDIQLTGEEDRLQSLEEFFENRGGDCEDYSLFFKAQQNYVLDRCFEKGAENFVIESWTPNPAKENKYIINFVEDKEWYITGVDVIELPEGYIYPNIVCGNIFDPTLNGVAGHCVIAYTKDKIKTINDVYQLLNKAPMIEPQDGRYMGLINDYSSGIYLNSNFDDATHHSYIWQVITDNDLFRYYRERDINWIGYSNFYDLLSERIMSLRDVKAKN